MLDDCDDPQSQRRNVWILEDRFFLLAAVGQHPYSGPHDGASPQGDDVLGSHERLGLLGNLRQQPLAVGRYEPVLFVEAQYDALFHLAQFGQDPIFEIFQRAVNNQQHQIGIPGREPGDVLALSAVNFGQARRIDQDHAIGSGPGDLAARGGRTPFGIGAENLAAGQFVQERRLAARHGAEGHDLELLPGTALANLVQGLP